MIFLADFGPLSATKSEHTTNIQPLFIHDKNIKPNKLVGLCTNTKLQ